MNNNNFEFKSYIATPDDQFMLGIAKVKLYGKVVANFKHVKTKDGTGDFFCSASYSIKDAMGEKKYLPCVMLDSRDDEEELLNFIRTKSHEAIAFKSAHKAQQAAPAPGVYYPHGLAQQTQPAAVMSEVAKQDDLPF